MKTGDKVRVDTIRFLVSAVRNQAIAKYGNAWETSIVDADVSDVIKKQVKSHKESVLSFETAGRAELAEKEKKELDILSAFLPKEISDEDLKAMLTDVVAASDPSNPSAGSGQAFGLLMKSAMAKVGGQADGARVSAMLKQLLSK